MKANPGGTIDPGDVIGRDGLIRRLWEVLGRQSIALVAERRMGKTCVTTKMKAEAPGGMLTIWQDLEGLRSPLEFVEAVFHEVEGHLTRRQRSAARVRKLLAELSGAEFAGVRFPDIAAAHWKALLTKTMEDLAEDEGRPLVFFWDELPLMLRNIKERHDEDAAMELLDTLRAVRQTHTSVRMFFTGSIGLHNVITSLRKDGYVNAPINDMHVVELPPLALPDAAELARRLLEGEGFRIEPADPLPQVIARAVDCIPYYIHHVVDEMRQRHADCTAEAVEQIVSQCLTASQDSWELDHYRTRINGYYDEEDRPFVLGLLDVLAGAEEPLHFPELFNLLKSQIATEDEERARDLLTLLRRDHYVAQEDDGRFRFRYPLIQRWWRLNRGLTQ